MIEVARTNQLDKGICIFTKGTDLEKQVEIWERVTGLKITKYYKQTVHNGVIIASYVPKKEE
jgi:hypothetical protein